MRRSIAMLAVIVAAGLVGTALATPPSGTIVAETVRGDLDRELQIRERFDNGARVRLKTRGPIEIITQRITAEPGASFGWHTHPGPNVNVIVQGTLTLYHDERCRRGIPYGPGSAFATATDEVHLARNEGEEPVVLNATYLAPKTTPPAPARIDMPSPGRRCPQ